MGTKRVMQRWMEKGQQWAEGRGGKERRWSVRIEAVTRQGSGVVEAVEPGSDLLDHVGHGDLLVEGKGL